VRSSLSAAVLALLVSPGLHDGRDPVVKGPWYFLGLQELLHWTPWPLLAVGLLAAALLFVWWIPRWTPPVSGPAKRGLFAVTAGYFVLCVLALFMRGENWSLRAEGLVWPAGPGDLQAGPMLARAGVDTRTATLPLILGRPEGCMACHLKYSPETEAALAAYVPEAPDWNADGSPPVPPPPSGKPLPKLHPRLSVQADGSHCFGCHSRSSRIATSYEGWHEMRHDPSAAELEARPTQYRQLDDTRFFARKSADVHHTAGLDCIDCHTALEVMGSGQPVAHKAQALRVRCQDCHARPGSPLSGLDVAAIDPESRKILTLRGWTVPPGERVGATRSGDTLLNVTVDAQGRGQLRRKADGRSASLKPQLGVCAQGGGHERLSCSSCHTAWAPSCTSCHTSFDPKSEGHDHLAAKFVQGEWLESSVDFESGPPTLGVRIASGLGERGGELVDTFVPGMILTIDRNMLPGRPPDTVFRRLFAPMAAHTTQRQARACTSCHSDPVALGYGKGRLSFEASGRRTGVWHFTPAEPPSPQDGLPADAWTGFLAERSGMASTQAGARPFTVAEQRRILTVGACLTCHEGDSAVMRASVRDFPALLRRRTAQCVVPARVER